jgi:hypothetical protein
MAHGVTTEWEDIQVKYGNYLAREKEPTNDEIEKIALEVIENYDPLEKKTLDELKDLEDDEDEEVLKIYEAKRMEELKLAAQKPRFGRVIEFRKQDYITEVTNAPKDVYVVCHLYQNWSEPSNVLSRIFDNLAKKFIFVKFCRIVSNNCIENYRDSDVPGIIIYRNGNLYKQMIPATPHLGGSQMNIKSKKNKLKLILFIY